MEKGRQNQQDRADENRYGRGIPDVPEPFRDGEGKIGLFPIAQNASELERKQKQECTENASVDGLEDGTHEEYYIWKHWKIY